MKRFSWILALILALSTVFVFVGCPAADDDKPTTTTGGDQNQQTPTPSTPGGVGIGDGTITFGNGAGQVQVFEKDPPTGTITYANGGYSYTYGETGENKDYGGVILRFKIDLGEKELGDYGKVTFKWQATGYKDDDSVARNKKIFLLATDEESAITPPKHDDDSAEIKSNVVSTTWFDDNPAGKFWNVTNYDNVAGNEQKTITLPIVKADYLTGEVWFGIYVHAVKDTYTISDFKFVEGAYSGGVVIEGANSDSTLPDRPVPPVPATVVKPVFFTVDLADNKYKSPEGTGIVYDLPEITPATGVAADGSITVKFKQDRQRLNIKLSDEQVEKLLKRNKNNIKVVFDAEIVTDETSAAVPVTTGDFPWYDDGSGDPIKPTVTDGALVNYKDKDGNVVAAEDYADLDPFMSNTSGNVFRYHLGDASTGSNWNATSGPGPSTLANIKNATFAWQGARDNPFYFILQHGNYSGGYSENPSSSNEITIKIKSIVIGEDAPEQAVTFSAGDVKSFNGTIANVTSNGYTITQTAGYDWSYAYFKVTFATGYVLSDYTKFECKMTLLNTSYKPIKVASYAVGDAEPTGSMAADAVIAQSADWVAGNQDAEASVSLTIDIKAGEGGNADGNEVWIAIRSHAAENDSYKITDIKFKN